MKWLNKWFVLKLLMVLVLKFLVLMMHEKQLLVLKLLVLMRHGQQLLAQGRRLLVLLVV